ncbi:MAG: ABC transporter ATP-binding protein [Burkholderiaceae bacterium]|nr:ABC transporter ATP-binding protein [Burkholderiaceae bacterium]
MNIPNLLSVESLKLISSVNGKTLVDNVSYNLCAGEVLAMVGESGSGKTLAARAILGLLPPGIAPSEGRILMNGEDLLQVNSARMRAMRGAQIGMVFQEPMMSLNPAVRIGIQMAEGLRLHTQLTAAQIEARCLEILERVRIRDPKRCLMAYPHEFSGGMRQRIMLASVMLLKPRLLIADEPTTALDTLSQGEVLDLMTELAREEGTAVLLITHNLGLVARYAQRAVVMNKGVLVETGDVKQVLYSPVNSYTRKLIEALPRRGPVLTDSGVKTPLIEARNLSVSYRDNKPGWWRKGRVRKVLDSVNLTVHEGETVAVVGGSGSGKTTLGRAMLRLIASSGGGVFFRGHSIDGNNAKQFRLACQLVFQDPYSSLNPRQRIGDIVAEPLKLVRNISKQEASQRVIQTLQDVGLDGLALRFPHELSGGQRQRVAIARAIVRRPAFIVADEPVSALDMSVQAQVLALFQSLQKAYGFACLFISHDLAAVEQVSDRVVVMESGRIVEQGSRDTVFDQPQHAYTRALLAATPAL